jgi:hypothetical protein
VPCTSPTARSRRRSSCCDGRGDVRLHRSSTPTRTRRQTSAR